jgi:hypothetical protein
MRIALFALLLGLGGLACGPVESTSIQWQVERSMRRAERLGAERTAPYEITAARRYFKKAKEEAGYADFEASIDYFHKARLLAKQAEEKAEAAAKMPSRTGEPPPLPEPPAPPKVK